MEVKMDWNTLISVVIGGLIATIGSIINNRFQSKERDKDRAEQKREAKTQLALELMRNDVKLVEGLIDSNLTSVSQVIRLAVTWTGEGLSDNEIRERVHKVFYAEDESVTEGMVVDKLAYSLGHEFYAEYKTYEDLLLELADMFEDFERKLFSAKRMEELSIQITHQTAKLHTMLREKLISIRE
jgi:hypothetical protein